MTDGTEGLTPAQKGALTRKRNKEEAAKLAAGDTPKVADAPVVADGTTVAPATQPEAGGTTPPTPAPNPDIDPRHVSNDPKSSDVPLTDENVETVAEVQNEPDQTTTAMDDPDGNPPSESSPEMTQEQHDAAVVAETLPVPDPIPDEEVEDDGKVAIKVLDAGQNPVEVRVNGRVLVSIPIGSNARVNADVITHLDAAGVEYVKIKE